MHGQDQRLRGVVFDLDGTLIIQTLDFDAMRREIGLPLGSPILESLERMEAADRKRALTILLRHERAAAEAAAVLPGVTSFLDWLEAHGVQRGLLSRNARECIDRVLERCGLHFDQVIAREDAPYKPDPRGLWQICEAWQVRPSEVLMVGDFLYDIQVGRNAGTRTALITHGHTVDFADHADIVFATFEELTEMLREWVEGED